MLKFIGLLLYMRTVDIPPIHLCWSSWNWLSSLATPKIVPRRHFWVFFGMLHISNPATDAAGCGEKLGNILWLLQPINYHSANFFPAILGTFSGWANGNIQRLLGNSKVHQRQCNEMRFQAMGSCKPPNCQHHSVLFTQEDVKTPCERLGLWRCGRIVQDYRDQGYTAFISLTFIPQRPFF